MNLVFQTLRSSSSGNCLRITCDHTTVLFDCGFKAQRDCEQVIGSLDGQLAGVVISHSHTDHIGYCGLRVLGKRKLTAWAHQRVWEQIWDRETEIDWQHGPNCEPFADGSFVAGDFEIRAIEVPHAPGVPNYGFVVHCGSGRSRRKLVLCTDFFDFQDILPECVDADFIYVESNHDLELLRLFPNYASRFHLSNVKTGKLLAEAIGQSGRAPRAVVLGHLSRQRNRAELAIETVTRALDGAGIGIDFPLLAAPLYEPSAIVPIA